MAANVGRLSATTILLRRVRPNPSSRYDYQLLMQKRGNISRAGTYTFPGGVFEDSDRHVKVTAVRELFEETGVLLRDRAMPLDPVVLESWRLRVHDDPSKFDSMLQVLNIDIKDGEKLQHFCTFITPEFEKRKYTTLFFLTEGSEAELRGMAADGTETETLEWLDPEEALAKNRTGEMKFLPPQFYVLSELSHYFEINRVFSHLLECTQDYAHGDVTALFSRRNAKERVDGRGFPAMQPHPVPGEDKKTIVLTLPYDAEHHQYPGRPSQVHRVVAHMPMGIGRYFLRKEGIGKIINKL